MKLNLPKGYLSYSSMNTWKSSKDQFRKKYYSSEAYDLDTPYTRFGKEIAETLEDPRKIKKHPVLKKIPVYELAEYQVEHEIEGVPIKAYLDGFCPYHFKVMEYKTGIRKDGKAPWNALKVRKHEQVLLYSLLIKDLHGYVDPVVTLCWLETHWAEQCEDTIFGGETFKKCTPGLALTGHFEVFEREIKDWEHLKMRQSIRRIAEEISEDYTRYQQTCE